MQSQTMQAVFGPVRSSRLGLSLGLDLLGDRICSFDCLYCESGRTRVHTMARAAYVPAETVLHDLEKWLADNDASRLDHVTLGGSGEPCLNSDLGRIISGVKTLVPDIPVAILTNSSFLTETDVRQELGGCDVILPSLDTLVSEEFWRINRPCVKLNPQDIAHSLLTFARTFPGRIYLEILLVHQVNDSERNQNLLSTYCQRLRPDRIDVVTMNRPGAHVQRGGVDAETLSAWRSALKAEIPVFTDHTPLQAPSGAPDTHRLADRILASLQRRPQTEAQLASALGVSQADVKRSLQTLHQTGQVSEQSMDGYTYFLLKQFEPE